MSDQVLPSPSPPWIEAAAKAVCLEVLMKGFPDIETAAHQTVSVIQRYAAQAVVAGQAQNQRLYNALAKMFLWQADKVNELMPDGLSDEVKALLGEQMVDAIIESACGTTVENIYAQALSDAHKRGWDDRGSVDAELSATTNVWNTGYGVDDQHKGAENARKAIAQAIRAAAYPGEKRREQVCRPSEREPQVSPSLGRLYAQASVQQRG